MNQVNLGLGEQERKEVAQKLNKLLSDEFTLYVKTLNYHWNVKDPNFIELHKFFEEQYEGLFKSIDKIAERVRALGFIAFGCQQEFLNATQLKENKFNTIPDEQTMVKDLLNDHETIIRSIREDLYPLTVNLADYATNNLLANLIEKKEKTAWMLRSSVK